MAAVRRDMPPDSQVVRDFGKVFEQDLKSNAQAWQGWYARKRWRHDIPRRSSGETLLGRLEYAVRAYITAVLGLVGGVLEAVDAAGRLGSAAKSAPW